MSHPQKAAAHPFPWLHEVGQSEGPSSPESCLLGSPLVGAQVNKSW